MMKTLDSEIYLGIMSGTSIDAIDIAAVDFQGHSFHLLGTHTEPYPQTLRQSVKALCEPGINEIERLGQLDVELGLLFAKACNNFLKSIRLDKSNILAIGSHGQTIRHQPWQTLPFTLQIGDPNVIAELTGITTISDFRRRDLVYQGQGAPLAPAFHNFAFRSKNHNRVVVNVGGISNITLLPADLSLPVRGFDTGPGNTLLDLWVNLHLGLAFDREGHWSSQGTVDKLLLEKFLADAYFQLPPPKSTGREYFNLEWLKAKIERQQISPQDVQATLVELTARCINDAISELMPGEKEVLVCGGGAFNKSLMDSLMTKLQPNNVCSTEKLGVDPRFVEAIAFAWLARQTFNKLPGNLPAVTGANREVILGGIYFP